MNRRAQTARRRRRRGGIAETGSVAVGGACWGVGEDPPHCHRASVERYRVVHTDRMNRMEPWRFACGSRFLPVALR